MDVNIKYQYDPGRTDKMIMIQFQQASNHKCCMILVIIHET